MHRDKLAQCAPTAAGISGKNQITACRTEVSDTVFCLAGFNLSFPRTMKSVINVLC